MTITDGAEGTLGQLLNDPDAMAQILSLAQSLGLQPPEASPPEKPRAASAKPPAPFRKPPEIAEMPEMPDMQMMQSMMRLLQQAQQTDGKQEALFCALKPYLAPEKREKLDRALQMSKLSRLAGFAMKNYGTLDTKGGK